MYHCDPITALEELNEDALLPNPANLRDMILRASLAPEQALTLNREFQVYAHDFAALQKHVRRLLEELALAPHKHE